MAMNKFSFVAFLLVILALSISAVSAGQTYNVSPSTGNAAILRIVAGLKAGDLLNLNAGVYVNLNLNLANLAGSADAWIVIRGNNATLQCGGSVAPIVIGACANIRVEGLKITTTGAKSISGIKFQPNAINITLANLVLLNINNHGIDLSAVNNLVNIVITGCDISACGKVRSTGGVAIYVGGITAAVSNVASIIIDNNSCHDIVSAGAAIQVLLGVVAPQVTNNVVKNCNNGIRVVTGICNNVIDLLPRVVGNLVTDISVGVGITVGSGTQCANNIIANVNIGINLVLGGSLTVLANTTIAHNTIYQVSSFCIQALVGLPDVTLVIANNALATGQGVVGNVLNIASGILNSVATILNNVVSGNIGVNLNLGVSLGKRSDALPINFLGVALDDLFGGLSTVVSELKLIPLDSLVNEVLNTVQDVVDQVGALVQNILSDVQTIVDNLVPNLKALLNALGLGGLLDPVLDAVEGIVDDLVPDLNQTVGDLIDSLDNLIPVLKADLAPLLTTTLHEVETALSDILSTLGVTLGNVLGALGKRDAALPADLSTLATSLQNAISLVVGSVGGEVAPLLAGVENTVDNLVNGLLDGSIVNVQLDINLAGLSGLVHAVEALVNEILTSVDVLLQKVLGGLDFDLNVRVGRLTIGARQIGLDADLYASLGSYAPFKLQTQASVAVAVRSTPIRSE